MALHDFLEDLPDSFRSKEAEMADLRKARMHATELRSLLETVAGDVRDQYFGTSFYDTLSELSDSAGEIEGWLDDQNLGDNPST